MTCEELSFDYAAYALGVLDESQRAEINAHLASGCPACVPGVSHAMATVGGLAGSVTLTEPPARLRRRVLGMVDAQPKNSWSALLIPWAVAAVLAAVLVYTSIVGAGARRRQSEQNAKVQQALYILNDPETHDASFGMAQKPASGKVFVSASRGVVFVGSNMPTLPDGKTFELWIIPGTGKPIPAGTFASEQDTNAVYVWRHPVANGAAAVAVTVEPEGGSPQPTTQPFIVASLGTPRSAPTP